jgi:hypothetical protein
LGLIPIALFAIWLYLGRLQKRWNLQEVQQAGDAIDPG